MISIIYIFILKVKKTKVSVATGRSAISTTLCFSIIFMVFHNFSMNRLSSQFRYEYALSKLHKLYQDLSFLKITVK